MDYRAFAQAKREEVLHDLQHWVQKGSVYDKSTSGKGKPFGDGVASALGWIADIATKDGFAVDPCNGYCTEITYGNQSEMVMVLGHADVVPLGSGWTKEPFGGTIENDILYGRGASDDKGPTLAAYYALKIIKEQQIPLKRKIRIVVGGNEESGSRCLHYYFQTLKRPHPTYGFTPDANFPLIYGEKGIMTYIYSGEIEDEVIADLQGGVAANSVPDDATLVATSDLHLAAEYHTFLLNHKVTGNYEVIDGVTHLTLHGKAAHGSTPDLGINAVVLLLQFLATYTNSTLAKHFAPRFEATNGKGLHVDFTGKKMGSLTVNVGIGEYHYGSYRFILNIRYPIELDSKAISKILRDERLHESKMTSDSTPLFIDPHSQFIRVLQQAYQEISGDYETKPMTIGGGTYARSTVNTVAFGMEFPTLNHGSGNIHSPDESIAVEDLLLGIAIYMKAIIDLANL